MKTIKIITITIISTIILVSCNNIETKIVGTWSIDSIVPPCDTIYNNNVIAFTEEGECQFPISSPDQNKIGKWFANSSKDSLSISVLIENNDFNGSYIIEFWKDYETKLYKCTLIGEDDKRVFCSKLFQHYQE